uniref:Uncharacterized protein n=1 Tax=Rhizophora mucronata TaxID=61149 RepID=A0A2P2J893_RHIMU
MGSIRSFNSRSVSDLDMYNFYLLMYLFSFRNLLLFHRFSIVGTCFKLNKLIPSVFSCLFLSIFIFFFFCVFALFVRVMSLHRIN